MPIVALLSGPSWTSPDFLCLLRHALSWPRWRFARILKSWCITDPAGGWGGIRLSNRSPLFRGSTRPVGWIPSLRFLYFLGVYLVSSYLSTLGLKSGYIRWLLEVSFLRHEHSVVSTFRSLHKINEFHGRVGANEKQSWLCLSICFMKQWYLFLSL